ncbi:MAG: N-acetyltransferase [Flavipsychrobacter sp.]|jgi:phosphinothricin acetyltransferase|nr:N-acetyltransferase [Flavipsychrobacter sp.]
MIRIAAISDLEAITGIYNQAIDAGFQTAFTERLKTEDRVGWFEEHTESYPLFVYEDVGKVVGWLSISEYRHGRGALRYAAEVSYFIDKDFQGKGIGIQLLMHGINASRILGYKTLLAIILEPNIASAKLLAKAGFEQWAYLPRIADFAGIECSQVYYGLKLQ